MKILLRNASRAVFATLFALALVALPAYANDGIHEPFNVEATLVTPARIALGEPILVRYKITNYSPYKVAVHLGIYGTDWYTLTMRDDHGAVVSTIPDPRPKHPQGSHPSQDGFFRTGEASTDYIPVTKRLSIQRPGRYTLTVHVAVPYAIDDTPIGANPEALMAASGLAQTQDIVFPILVTSADPVRLRATADSLRQAALTEQDSLLARAEVEALFSIPEAQAAASWRSLALKPNPNTGLAVSELAELHSAVGVDILAEMLNNPALQYSSINESINRLYNLGTPTLREHIKVVARRHGFEMPEVAGTPYVPKDEEPSRGGITF